MLLNPDDFVEMDRGMYGYPQSLRFGEIVILYGGRPEMGVHLSMTGAGCREYENIGKVPWSDPVPRHARGRGAIYAAGHRLG